MIVLSEVIEHLLNPGRMLERLKLLTQPETTSLLITVPNAFTVNNLLNMTHGVEYVHPDHNRYFSHVTLHNLLPKTGVDIAEEFVYTFQTDVLPRRIHRRIATFPQERLTADTDFGWMRTTYWRMRAAPGRLLRRIVASYLYSRTAFWGDGLIAVCRKR